MEDSVVSVDELKKLKEEDLNERLNNLGKPVSGLKQDLVLRLHNALTEHPGNMDASPSPGASPSYKAACFCGSSTSASGNQVYFFHPEKSKENYFRLGDLPDDILLYISLLPSLDVFNVSAVCARFDELCCQKAVVRRLDFQRCYQLSEILLGFFFNKIRRANVQHLNLNHCYWFSDSFLNSISTMENLKELHIVDCDVSVELLLKMLRPFRLEALSWSWNQLETDVEFDPNVEAFLFAPIKSCLANVKRLALHLNDVFCIPRVVVMLQHCPHLETLEIFKRQYASMMCSLPMISFPMHVWAQSCVNHTPCLTKLKKLRVHVSIVRGDDTEMYVKMLSRIVGAATCLEEFWVRDNCCGVLGYCFDVNKLTLAQFYSFDAISLSEEEFPNVYHRPLLNGDDPLGEPFLSRVLCHGGPFKCRKLSLDFLLLSTNVLQAVAQQCPLLEHLSIQDCVYFGLATDNMRGLKDIAIHCKKLTHLNLTGTHFCSTTEHPVMVLASLTNLKSLSVSTSMLLPPWGLKTIMNRSQPTDPAINAASLQQYVSVRRIRGEESLTEDERMKRSCLSVLTDNCPDLVEFALHGQDSSIGDKIPDSTLACIFKWEKLQHLSLINIASVEHGHFLFDILKHCQELTTLKLTNVGPQSTCVYIEPLMKGFRYASSLKDLSLFQKGLHINTDFCQGLENCQKLERLCLANVSVSGGVAYDCVCHMVAELSRLVMLYILTNSSETLRNDLIPKLQRFQSQRPAFTCMVFKCAEELSPCPPVHVCEMVVVPSE